MWMALQVNTRDVTKFEFEFECWRILILNVFAKFEIRRIVGDACIGCGSHFHALINAKHALARNAVNDSQHMSHNYKQCRRFGHPLHHLMLGGRAAAAVAVTSSVGLTLKFSQSCYMRHLAIITGTAMHPLGLHTCAVRYCDASCTKLLQFLCNI